MSESSYSSLAQSVERMTVNHDVAGSSPAGGAMMVGQFCNLLGKALIFKAFLFLDPIFLLILFYNFFKSYGLEVTTISCL